MIIKIAMKEGTSKREFLSFTSWLDNHGKLLSNAEQTDDGRFAAIACLDDGADYLAFLISTGLCRLTTVPPNPYVAQLTQIAPQEEQP